MAGELVARSAAIDLQRAGIAVLDSDGNVTWTDEAWAADDGEGSLPRVPIGANLLESYRGYSDPTTQAIANAIAAVLERKVTYFEIEHRVGRDSRSFLMSVAALRGSGAGAVVIEKVVGGREPPHRHRPTEVRATGGPSPSHGSERLTPREREVLGLMAVGLDNRAIAAKLRIEYTTVRGHVRAVIEKLGARSRLEAVARAYRNGWVPKE
ncbi:MAG TPA: helix-turn-helix transcriptional regulator [Candidatus Bathyarchaeia archaeon]|nr:helix-turn-helix transcriptional regulator [Candidatus Bathyarchaeia archaeon]